MAIEHTIYLREVYGVDRAVERILTPEIQAAYARTLLVVAGADGLSPAERDYFVAWQRASGHPAELVSAMEGFDFEAADVKDTVNAFKALALATGHHASGLIRGLLYDAVRISSIDGRYSAKERAVLRHVATLLEVDDAMVASLEGLVEIESAARHMRLRLFGRA